MGYCGRCYSYISGSYLGDQPVYFVPGYVISYREAVSTGIIISFPLSLLLYVSIRFASHPGRSGKCQPSVQVTEEKTAGFKSAKNIGGRSKKTNRRPEIH